MFAPVVHAFHNWRLRNAARRKLALLDDRLLADIGTKRSAISDFVAQDGSCSS